MLAQFLLDGPDFASISLRVRAPGYLATCNGSHERLLVKVDATGLGELWLRVLPRRMLHGAHPHLLPITPDLMIARFWAQHRATIAPRG